MNDNLSEMYRDIILDHYRHPRGHHHIDHPDVSNEGKNPSCGDEISVQLKLNGDVVEQVGVHCAGCAISVASGSMLSEVVEGKSVAEVKQIAAAVRAMLTGESELPEELNLGDLDVLEGVKQFPVRIKCALLAWATLVDGLEQAEQKNKQSEVISTE